jgi:hypothetical protein
VGEEIRRLQDEGTALADPLTVPPEIALERDPVNADFRARLDGGGSRG